MSRSIHKTVAQVVRDNSREEIADPNNPDVAELARKIEYKKSERRKRRETSKAAALALDGKAEAT